MLFFSFLDLSEILAFQKWQKSQGSVKFGLRNPEQFLIRLVSSRLNNVNNQGTGGVVVAKPQNVVMFGFAAGERKKNRR